MYSIKKILVVLLCTFPLTTYATELFVTEEALDAVIKNFISDMSDEGVDIDISVSTCLLYTSDAADE